MFCLRFHPIAISGVLVAFVLSLPKATFSEETRTFVEEGEARNTRFVGEEWSSKNGSLVMSGPGRLLELDSLIGPGDFTVDCRMRISRLDRSAASVVMNGNHFGFEGSHGEMFSEGPSFGKQSLGPPVVHDGKPFDMTITRVGDLVSIRIDKEVVFETQIDSATLIELGLRPWRSEMQVQSLVVTGEFQDRPDPLPETIVFERGKGDYHTYRIPAIIVTRDDTLLAFAEGRKDGGGDAGDIDMLVRRSNDGGKTWSQPIVIWNDGKNTCGNPSPVVDQSTGRIWLLMTWNLGSDHESQILAGTSEQVRRVFVTHSDDDGLTWSSPKDISESTRRKHWRWYATGPGNAIQLRQGEHRGRLVVPANHSDHRDPSAHPFRSHVIYSDDHGESWQVGGIHDDRTNESAIVERQGGELLQAMRSYHGTQRRAMAVSRDGGESFGDVYLDEALDTPVCQASLIRLTWADAPDGDGKSRIVFSSPRGGSRSSMTIWLSLDEGQSWPHRKEVYSGAAAYSNLVALPDGNLGLLFEKNGYQSITFVTIPIDWLGQE